MMTLPKKRAHTDYVNHMIRFYLTCPDGLQVSGHTTADVRNWMAVQAVLSDLDEDTRQLIHDLYAGGARFEETIQRYADEHGVAPGAVWKTYSQVTTSIARQRGLI